MCPRPGPEGGCGEPSSPIIRGGRHHRQGRPVPSRMRVQLAAGRFGRVLFALIFRQRHAAVHGGSSGPILQPAPTCCSRAARQAASRPLSHRLLITHLHPQLPPAPHRGQPRHHRQRRILTRRSAVFIASDVVQGRLSLRHHSDDIGNALLIVLQYRHRHRGSVLGALIPCLTIVESWHDGCFDVRQYRVAGRASFSSPGRHPSLAYPSRAPNASPLPYCGSWARWAGSSHAPPSCLAKPFAASPAGRVILSTPAVLHLRGPQNPGHHLPADRYLPSCPVPVFSNYAAHYFIQGSNDGFLPTAASPRLRWVALPAVGIALVLGLPMPHFTPPQIRFPFTNHFSYRSPRKVALFFSGVLSHNKKTNTKTRLAAGFCV